MGHSSRHVGDMGKTEALDREIIAEAQRSKEVIITHDLDYGRLLAFSRESTPSVIIYFDFEIHTQRFSPSEYPMFGPKSKNPSQKEQL